MPKSSRSSFPVSTVEWIASLYMAALPVTSAAPNLQIAIATLPAIAAMMTRSEPECSATIPPPPRRPYLITTGRPLPAIALGGDAFAPDFRTFPPSLGRARLRRAGFLNDAISLYFGVYQQT